MPRLPNAQRGMGYVYLLMVVLLLSLGVGRSVELYATRHQREQEAELLRVGALYRKAIKDYYLSAQTGPRKYPEHVEDLLRDPRHIVTRRYLRRLYLDPMTSRPLVLLRAPTGGIWGVASASTKPPMRTNLPLGVTPATATATARSYRDWAFVYDGNE